MDNPDVYTCIFRGHYLACYMYNQKLEVFCNISCTLCNVMVLQYLKFIYEIFILNLIGVVWLTQYMDASIKIGVTLGSIIGPLLHLVYVNDIETSCDGVISSFADDNFNYVTFKLA